MARWGGAAAALAVLSIFLLLGPSSSVGRSEADARNVYRAWIARHSHALGSDIDFDDDRRFKAFRDNLDFIDEHNARAGVGYRLGTTAYAHLTNDEFRAAYAVGKGLEAYGDIGATVDDTPLPDHVDWRTSGAVAPVKSQGQCGSCWAFAAIAAVESATKIANNASDIITMSEQQIVDCVRSGRSKGCQYGFVTEALDFIAAHGACPDSEYPYTGSDTDTCRNCYITVGGMAGFESVPGNNESALLIAVARQPVIVFIESSGREFQLYESGVFSGPCGTAMDHFVVAVGYGTTDDGKPFWLVRNSWGDGWGESGYVRMERSSGTVGAGLCGIATAPMYPVVHVK